MSASLTVICVLKSGGSYTQDWVGKLKSACKRHLSIPHSFKCLTDTFVLGSETIPLKHDWPGWWAKIELFRPGVINGPTLYLDLDTVLVGSIDCLGSLPNDFAMMRNVWQAHMPGSAVMWFRKVPHKVYEMFSESPEEIMSQYQFKGNPYMGDQGFIWDAMDRKVDFIENDGLIRSYRKHCLDGVPEGCSLVAFGGQSKPNTVNAPWVKEAWCQ